MAEWMRRRIVIAFDIGEQVAPRGIAIGVFAVVDELGFQSAEETLHWRIVPAVSLAAHRLDDGGGWQDVAIVAGESISGSLVGSEPTLLGPNCARLSKVPALRRPPSGLVERVRDCHRVPAQAVACAAGDVAYNLPSRSWIRPARRWRCTEMPIWFG